MLDPEKAAFKKEQKKEKRIAHIMWRSTGAAGAGVGLFLLRFLVAPFIGNDEQALHAIASFAFALMGFGGLMVVLFIFRRAWLPQAYLAMVWVVLPVILLKLLAGVF